jgi:sensor histidine kinase YesM
MLVRGGADGPLKKNIRHYLQWKHMTFYKKLLILYCLLVTLLVGCFYTASYYTSRKTLDLKTENYMKHMGDLISLKIWQNIDELDTTIQRAIFDMYLTELLSSYNEKTEKDRQTALDYISGKVNQLISLNPYVKAVDFYFYNGDEWITPTSKRIPDVFHSSYYRINNLNQKLEWIDFEQERKSFNGAKILMDSKGRAIALLVIKVNQTFLADLMSNMTDQFIFNLTNQNGIIMSSSSSDPNILGSKRHESHNDSQILTDREVIVLHWKLYLEVPKITFSSYVALYGENQIILTLVILFLGFLTSLAMAFSISKPIKRLSNQMRRIAAEDLHMSGGMMMRNEIAFLENSFYSMVRRIDSLINNVYNETILRRESELKALQAQINPHFLFNALDLLNWKALMAKHEEISEIVQSLARLMEANLTIDEKTVTIHKEISYIRDYFKIMSKKFGDQIVLYEEVTEEAMIRRIPKLLLQPLVENSIKHGFQYVESGAIWMRISASDGRIKISIEDTGQGMSAARLLQIRTLLNDYEQNPLFNNFNQEGERERESIGILNIYQRIRIIYGQYCSFKLNSEEGKGTVIEIELPDEVKGIV